MVHQFTCSACSFQVRSDDDGEVVDFVQEHADEMHDMTISESDVRDGIENV